MRFGFFLDKLFFGRLILGVADNFSEDILIGFLSFKQYALYSIVSGVRSFFLRNVFCHLGGSGNDILLRQRRRVLQIKRLVAHCGKVCRGKAETFFLGYIIRA